MMLSDHDPLPAFARLFAQSGAAAAAWSGMWYGLAIGAMDVTRIGGGSPPIGEAAGEAVELPHAAKIAAPAASRQRTANGAAGRKRGSRK